LAFERIECAEWSVTLMVELEELLRCISSLSKGDGVPIILIN
jgi:hypothetical protein